MPSVPGTSFQLVILLLLVLPGTVYQFVRTRLRGPKPDDASALNRVLRALGVSAALVALYGLTAGPRVLALLRRAQDPDAAVALSAVRPLAWWALALLFVVPALLAVGSFLAPRVPRPPGLQWLRLSYDPTPRAWDYAFNGIGPRYVRILTTDGRYLGGWYGTESFVSSYPEPREIFLEIAHQMQADGEFGPEVPNSSGLYVRCDDVRLVEFVDPATAGSTP